MDNSGISIAIHVSELPHQKKYGEFISKGLNKLGIDHRFTDPSDGRGDVHICIGPHHAYLECLGKPTIYIDRCLWGNDFDYVTIGWLSDEGGIVYPVDCDDKRPKPELKEWKEAESNRVLYLFDYGLYPPEYKKVIKVYPDTTIRPHPATGKNQPELLDHMKGAKVVIGHRTSALATALINGYPVISLDNRSSVYQVAGHDIMDIKRPDRTQWLNNMSYAQWSRHEIANGEALEYVINSRNKAAS